MAIKCISDGGSAAEFCREFILDSEADVADLPAAFPGSTAIVADETAAIYMVNASGEWKKIG